MRALQTALQRMQKFSGVSRDPILGALSNDVRLAQYHIDAILFTCAKMNRI